MEKYLRPGGSLNPLCTGYYLCSLVMTPIDSNSTLYTLYMYNVHGLITEFYSLLSKKKWGILSIFKSGDELSAVQDSMIQCFQAKTSLNVVFQRQAIHTPNQPDIIVQIV